MFDVDSGMTFLEEINWGDSASSECSTFSINIFFFLIEKTNVMTISALINKDVTKIDFTKYVCDDVSIRYLIFNKIIYNYFILQILFKKKFLSPVRSFD
jgi:hypothetical protein